MMQWLKTKRTELISRLPTILDLLEFFADGEIRHEEKLSGSIFQCLMPDFNQDGLFEIVSNYPDGTDKIIPLSIMNDYYRGESEPHFPSYPSIYRSGMTENDILIERVKACELELLIETYPLFKVFKGGISYQFKNNSTQIFNLSVDSEALAQHYGIKTDLLDLTVDKFVAAFFATTVYRNGKYIPVDPSKDDMPKYGVFYDYMLVEMSLETKHIDPKLRVVGFQPFSRPGEQRGYVLRIKQGEDFHRICRKRCYKFRHDAKVSELIYNYTNRSNKLFPKSILEEKTDKIRTSKTFSRAALAKTKERYYPNLNVNELEKVLRQANIAVSENQPVQFSEAEKKVELKKWQERGFEEFKKVVIVRTTFTGDAMGVNSNK
jgi:hypothetical protein